MTVSAATSWRGGPASISVRSSHAGGNSNFGREMSTVQEIGELDLSGNGGGARAMLTEFGNRVRSIGSTQTHSRPGLLSPSSSTSSSRRARCAAGGSPGKPLKPENRPKRGANRKKLMLDAADAQAALILAKKKSVLAQKAAQSGNKEKSNMTKPNSPGTSEVEKKIEQKLRQPQQKQNSAGVMGATAQPADRLNSAMEQTTHRPVNLQDVHVESRERGAELVTQFEQVLLKRFP